MDTDPRYECSVRSAGPSTPDPEPPEDDPDSIEEEPEEPPQTWKHPDDGKSLSDLDEERPLKP
ncbi:hypothetical protein NVV94_15000 [Pseudomonas sp. LS1212]|uniref:hypothetical protein n=1 Tax=Pseudomonas sp. LS1212 TaxID=2972478 RepID=UPI00215BC229|nr:hypothetical protein [Pseudomonas sp. LS1212]UVJ41996.1 hypothetical protein NVV94_15000 [Pseudomonas sp. LS1212]